MTVENLILQNLIFNDEYSRKVVPFIQEEYFHDRVEREVLKEIKTFILRYSNLPTINAIKISLDKNKIFSEKEHEQAIKILESLKDEKQNKEWLIEETEKFCKDKAIYNAIVDGIKIIDGKDGKRTADAIPQILTEALGVSFDSSVGHDYLADSESRFDYYHKI